MKTGTSRYYSEIDFIRISACLGVVLYHYIHEEGYSFIHSFEFVNGSWAYLLVSVFFAVSGFVLYKKYSDTGISDLKDFYVRRAKSMYPLFYVSYAYTALIGIFTGALTISLKPVSTWILTFFELDGYFSARFETHYLIGEWFAGALILLYLLFPILLKIMKSHPLVLMVSLIIADLLIVHYDLPTLSIIYSNLVNCCLRLYMGMLCAHYDLHNRKWIFPLSAVFLLVFCTVEFPFFVPLLRTVAGFAMFIVLFNFGRVITGLHAFQKPLHKLSGLTYPVFLIHAATIKGLFLFIHPDSWLIFWLAYVLVIGASFVQAYLLNGFTAHLMKQAERS